MPLTQRWTLTRYQIGERRRFPDASGELNSLLLDVSLACKAIARIVSFGEVADSLEMGFGIAGVETPGNAMQGGTINVQGEIQKSLDVI